MQTLKPEVRDRLIEAAIDEFAAQGYAGARVGEIAARARLSTGNVYRYFKGKAALFEAALDADFVERFTALLDARVASLAALPEADALDDDARRRQAELLDFWIAHRRRVVLLLDRCDGTPHEGFGARFVERLVEVTLAHLRERRDGPLPPETALVLGTIFDGARRTIVTILEQVQDEAEIRAAFAAFWSFQLAGLAGFTEGVTR